jgi:hypothetical protein
MQQELAELERQRSRIDRDTYIGRIAQIRSKYADEVRNSKIALDQKTGAGNRDGTPRLNLLLYQAGKTRNPQKEERHAAMKKANELALENEQYRIRFSNAIFHDRQIRTYQGALVNPNAQSLDSVVSGINASKMFDPIQVKQQLINQLRRIGFDVGHSMTILDHFTPLETNVLLGGLKEFLAANKVAIQSPELFIRLARAYLKNKVSADGEVVIPERVIETPEEEEPATNFRGEWNGEGGYTNGRLCANDQGFGFHC